MITNLYLCKALSLYIDSQLSEKHIISESQEHIKQIIPFPANLSSPRAPFNLRDYL